MRISPYLLLAAAALFWGGNFVVGRAMSADIPPLALNFWRWFGALIILFPFTCGGLWRRRRIVMENWRILLALGVTGVGAFHSFVYIALISTTAVNGALFLATIPALIPAISFVLDREVLHWRQLLGIAASLLGVVTIISRADLGALMALSFNEGDLLMLIAAPFWALYSVLLKRRPAALPPMTLLITIMCIGVVLLAPVYLWELNTIGGFAITVESVGSIAYLAVFASVIAYIFWNRGVSQVGASRAGPFMHLVPVFAAAMAVIFLGEALHLYHLIGVALIACGLMLANKSAAAPTPG